MQAGAAREDGQPAGRGQRHPQVPLVPELRLARTAAVPPGKPLRPGRQRTPGRQALPQGVRPRRRQGLVRGPPPHRPGQHEVGRGFRIRGDFFFRGHLIFFRSTTREIFFLFIFLKPIFH